MSERDETLYVEDMLSFCKHACAGPRGVLREIVGTRNRLAHGYLGIAAETVWSIINDDLPPLQRKPEALLAKLRQ